MQLLLLASLVAVPALMALALLMEWLECRFADRDAATTIARLLADELPLDRLEQDVAAVAKPVLQRVAARG